MPTPKKHNGAKKPEPVIGFAHYQRPGAFPIVCQRPYRGAKDMIPGVWTPMPSKRAAHELLPIIQALLDNPAKKKWEAMSYDAKVEATAKQVYERERGQGFRGAAFPVKWEDMPPAYKCDYLATAKMLLSLQGEPTK